MIAYNEADWMLKRIYPLEVTAHRISLSDIARQKNDIGILSIDRLQKSRDAFFLDEVEVNVCNPDRFHEI